jgi:hypothetical protein
MWNMMQVRCPGSVILLLFAGFLTLLPAQSSERGITFYSSFQGNSSNIGFVMRLDNSIGYNFNRFLGVDAGLPFYFIRPPDSLQSQLGNSSVNGIGNLYTDLRVSVPNPILTYFSTVTVTAPTGDREKGLSTGKVTWDWNNHIDRALGRLTPFVNVGIANTITDTPFYVRPFVTRGFVSHFEGGSNVSFAHFFGVGGSAYAYEPRGEQTVVSRVVHRGQAPGTGPGQGRGRPKGVFESAAETVGPASIARDRGFSFWLDIIPAPVVFLEAGYSRSTSYSLDTVFWGIGVNAGSLVRKIRRQ